MNRIFFRSACLAVSATATVLAGCGVVFTTGKPGKLVNSAYEYSEKEQTALTYYLPKDMLEVTAQVDTKIVVGLEYPGGDETKAPVKKPAERSSKLEAFDVAVVTVADRARPFLLDAQSAGLYKNDSTFNVSESGLLESVNTKTTGAGGAVVQSVLKLAGEVLPFVQGRPSLNPSNALNIPQPAQSPQLSKNAVANALRGAYVRPRKDVPRASDSCGSPDATSDGAVRDFVRQYFGERIEMRFAFPKIPNRVQLKRDFCDTFAVQEARRGQLERSTAALDAATNPAAISGLTAKLRAQRAELDRASSASQAAREALNAAVAEVLVDEGVGTSLQSRTSKYVLDIESVPTLAEVQTLFSSNPTRDTVLRGLASLGKHRAEDLFEKTNSLVSLQVVQPLAGQADAQARSWAASHFEACKRGTSCIHFREPVLYSLNIATARFSGGATSNSDPIELQLPEDRLMLLVGVGSPIRAVDMPTNAWTKRDTVVTFNARGRLVSLQRNSGSSAEDASAAIQQGLRGGLTEYETSLTSIKDIGATRQAIALQPLEQQLAVAQKQLDVIKAQAALDATSANSQALIDASIANIERSLVEAQQQLVSAQNKLVSETAAGADHAGMHATEQANAALAAQIQQLKNEIELIKLKKEISELGNGASP